MQEYLSQGVVLLVISRSSSSLVGDGWLRMAVEGSRQTQGIGVDCGT